ncbi:hypothetical protein CesoFtcFv8_021426 [Champsocephalus esox]|uniref:Uncharacterized protein n=1 Tax=Champsocephalus esox TaxID=159716 RepID=A0AAN8BE75_9TELE|nr:hypothetical protein CesoFtcFv8_021426 [Champsocephalus esox]
MLLAPPRLTRPPNLDRPSARQRQHPQKNPVNGPTTHYLIFRPPRIRNSPTQPSFLRSRPPQLLFWITLLYDPTSSLPTPPTPTPYFTTPDSFQTPHKSLSPPHTSSADPSTPRPRWPPPALAHPSSRRLLSTTTHTEPACPPLR